MRRIPADQPRWSETLIFSLSFFFTTDIIASAVNFGTKALKHSKLFDDFVNDTKQKKLGKKHLFSYFCPREQV